MAEFTEYAPGTFCYVDVQSTDPTKAIAFYEQLFGLESETGDTPGGGAYTQFSRGKRAVFGLNGLSQEQQAAGVPSMWLSYIAVTDSEAAHAAVEAAGGSTFVPPTELPGVGTFALYTDPQGAMFGTWESHGFHGSQLANEHGTLIWNELLTSNIEAASAFYGAVFGWTAAVGEMPGRPYTVFTDGEEMHAGAMALTSDMANVPPNWSVYFAVDDFAAASARAIELGATAETPMLEIPGIGRFGVFRDPAGAYFSIIESAPPA